MHAIKVAAALLVAFTGIATSQEEVPRSYILRTTGARCSFMRDRVANLKLSIEGFVATSREPQPRAMHFGPQENDYCFVAFKGGNTLKQEVAKLQGVAYVVQDTIVKALQAPQSWGLDRIDQNATALDGAPFTPMYDGAGVTVYVLDTGINKEHVEFGGRASFGGDFVNEGFPEDRNGHGTHCAGTVAGSSYGVARKATVVGVKVLGARGSGSSEGVLNGVQWVIDNAPEPSILSMSVGGPKNEALEDAVHAAVAAGHLVVVAAGNDNNDACRFSPSGAGNKGSVITVMATDKPKQRATNDVRAGYSNSGPCGDIFAPGSEITSAWKGNSTAFEVLDGTSMATPHVAGALALLMQKNNKNAALARNELFAIAIKGRVWAPGYKSTNNFLQLPQSSTAAPSTYVEPVTMRPSPFPTSPTAVPTAQPSQEWRCAPVWKGRKDGCDCECGGGDPDCYEPYTKLFCNGKRAANNQVCDLYLDKCITVNNTQAELIQAGRLVTSYPDKASESEGGQSLSIAAGATAAVAVLVLGTMAAVLLVKRTRKSQRERRVALPEL